MKSGSSSTVPRRRRSVDVSSNSMSRLRISPGGFAPDFELPSTQGRIRLYASAGARPAVLMFVPEGGVAVAVGARWGPALDFFIINRLSEADNRKLAEDNGVTVLSDTEGAVHEMYRAAGDRATAVVLGKGLRVVSIHHAIGATEETSEDDAY